MKNIPEIKERLAWIRDSKEVFQLLDSVPESKELTKEIREILINGIAVFITKLIKHLDTKRPSKSSISNLLSRTFFKLQCAGIRYEGQQCLVVIIEKIMNETFEGFFSRRLNVKSKEFLDLEDCEPY